MNILHLDIETAPNKVYAWGLWGQDISINQIVEPGYTLCWAAKWHGKRDVMFSSVHRDGAEMMVKRIYDLIEEADAVCHYNGAKFDMPTLNKEFVLHGMEPPAPYKQIDLLHTAKKQFRFPSNKLDYVAQALGLGSKVKHMGMGLWHDCMEGNDRAWRLMERYNKQDVRLLEKLYKRLLPWITNHPNVAIYNDSTRPQCTRCGSTHVIKRGEEHTKTQTYQRYKCEDCKNNMRGGVTLLPKEKRSALLRDAR